LYARFLRRSLVWRGPYPARIVAADEDSIRDRARGGLLGLAVGDALGGPLEFRSAEQIVDRHGGPVSDMIGGGWLSLRPGQVTDDTDMACALARSLVERGGYESEAALANYVRWLKTEPPDIGITIRAVLEKVAAGVDVADAARQVHEQSGGRSAGNGSLDADRASGDPL
jgi:ADP-ribosyl-[dinitrogen reductase] hydrolase